jgi:CRP-like cAMP-binding protein
MRAARTVRSHTSSPSQIETSANAKAASPTQLLNADYAHVEFQQVRTATDRKPSPAAQHPAGERSVRSRTVSVSHEIEFHQKSPPRTPGRSRQGSDAPTDDAAQRVVKRHERILLNEEARILALGAEGERKRAAAAEAHERHMETGNVSLQIDERMRLWWPALLAANFLMKAKRELDLVHAIRALGKTFHPVARWRHCRMQRRLARRHLIASRHSAGNVPPVTPIMLKRDVQGQFFRNWRTEDLEPLIQHMQPISFNAGEAIMFDGDVDRNMFVITRGTLKLVIRDRARGKRRNLATAKAVFEVAAPTYVGEFALISREPRSASIFCETDVDGFFVTSDDFAQALGILSPELRKEIDHATASRRKENLNRFFRPGPSRLVPAPIFCGWDDKGLGEIAALMQPEVLDHGTVLYRCGERHDVIYLVADGVIKLTDEDNKPLPAHHTSVVGLKSPVQAVAGEIFGAFAVVFQHPVREETATCIGRCELWSVGFDDVYRIALSLASRLISSRQALKDQLARKMIPPPPEAFATLPLVKPVVPDRVARSVFGHSPTTVFCEGDAICTEGQRCHHIIVLSRGSISITYSDKNLSCFSERIDVRPVVLSRSNRDMSPSRTPRPKNAVNLHLQPVEMPMEKSFNDVPKFKELILIGWVELLTQSHGWRCSVQALGPCEAVVVSRSTLEDRLPPPVLAALEHKAATEALARVAVTKRLEPLTDGTFLGEASLIPPPVTPATAGATAAHRRRSTVSPTSAALPAVSRPGTTAIVARTASSSPLPPVGRHGSPSAISKHRDTAARVNLRAN